MICRCYPLCICERADAAASSAERVNSSWLGGSILASLGTFHQVRQPPSPSLHNIPRYLSLSLPSPFALVDNTEPHLDVLATVSQLWIGKDEYQEVGKSIVHRRAK